MELEKALGPDGFFARFYKKNWEIVGKDIWHVVKELFKKRKIVKQWNTTFLMLIPKTQEVKDFKV